MGEPRFLDEAVIDVRAGNGGNGLVSFRHEKFRPRGGPDGGQGGDGGDVVLVAEARKRSLLDFRYQKRFRAPAGDPGGPNDRSGRSGRDLVIPVPVGTAVLDCGSGALLGDMGEDGRRLVVARGGKGGKGNASFATPTRQTPDFAEPGGEGEARAVRLELKVLADVGIVGFPNAGKSSLVRRLSAARPKVADYPFTTLVPSLGVVSCGEDSSFVIADIPGLVEGAHEGRGLGDRFLRHVERTRVLLFLLDPAGDREPVSAYETLLGEISGYGQGLPQRRRIAALNKADLLPDRAVARACSEYFGREGVPFCVVSCVSGEGIDALKELLCRETALPVQEI